MIYIIDTIGDVTGMHLYNKALVDLFEDAGIKSKVISNYKDDVTTPKIKRFYEGKILKKLFKLLISYFSIFSFVIHNKNNVFIYHSYGLRLIDIGFILLCSWNRSFYVIVHDVFEIDPNNNTDKLKGVKVIIYKYVIKRIVCHAERTQEDLKEIGFKGESILFPHVDYSFDKSIDLSKVDDKVISSILSDKVNFLFFGQISLSKGIDYLIEAISSMDDKELINTNIIIAGMDKANLLNELFEKPYLKLINRYITDDELSYLFDRVNFVVLPYREIYQSGVLNMAVHFKKPVILSSLRYFDSFNKSYPSFSILLKEPLVSNLGSTIKNLSLNKGAEIYYADGDLIKYNEAHSGEALLKKLYKSLNTNGVSTRIKS